MAEPICPVQPCVAAVTKTAVGIVFGLWGVTAQVAAADDRPALGTTSRPSFTSAASSDRLRLATSRDLNLSPSQKEALDLLTEVDTQYLRRGSTA